MSPIIAAGCSCGAVRFTAHKRPFLQLVCHCLDCQDATGAAYSSVAFFKRKDCEWSGQLTESTGISAVGSTVMRQCCAECGELMFDSTDRFVSIIGVHAGAIEAPFVFLADCHQFIARKRPEVTIPESMKVHEWDLTASD